MYEMKPEYYIGIDMIDEEHKQLFKYADAFLMNFLYFLVFNIRKSPKLYSKTL